MFERAPSNRFSYSWVDSPHGAVTMFAVASVRAWAQKLLGVMESSMAIERADGRTQVVLRFALPNGIWEADAATLIALKRKRASRVLVESVLREVALIENLAEIPTRRTRAGMIVE